MMEGNKWVTDLCSINGNGGLHDQTQFQSAIQMLEEAVATWDSPKLQHIILTGAALETYALFIDRMKRHMPLKAYKAGIETDMHKGQHVHWMLIIDESSPDGLFDLDDDSSPVSKVMKRIQRTEPEFNVTLAQPRRYRTPFIPLNAHTLQDAADWFSYALKVRSKAFSGNCYWSSRGGPARRTCSDHRPDRPVKQNHLFDGDF